MPGEVNPVPSARKDRMSQLKGLISSGLKFLPSGHDNA